MQQRCPQPQHHQQRQSPMAQSISGTGSGAGAGGCTCAPPADHRRSWAASSAHRGALRCAALLIASHTALRVVPYKCRHGAPRLRTISSGLRAASACMLTLASCMAMFCQAQLTDPLCKPLINIEVDICTRMALAWTCSAGSCV